MSEIKDYDKGIEDLFLQFLISEPELFVRCKSIIDADFFEDMHNQKMISFLEMHSQEYSSLPTLQQIKAVTGKTIEKLDAVQPSHVEWFLHEFESFCRYKALEKVILSSVDMLQKKEYGAVEKAVKEAVQIGLVKDLGTDYFHDPMGRLEAIKDNRGMITTGWRDIDKKLYGGFNRGEITIFAGQPGAGKSLFLQNLAVNWADAGLNVVYLTLELSENLTSMRLDAMTTGYETREVLKNSEDVAMRVKTYQKKCGGAIRLKYMGSGSTTNDFRAYIKELEIQTERKVDAILVDYLDLCWPCTVKVSASDQFIKDKYVSEELRNMAQDLDVLFATASQLNRGSFDEIEFDPSHIAGGISKVNTADNVVGIFVTSAMKEAGRYQIQFLKTRSSSGVGSKVDLAFNPKTLRISDLEEGEEGALTSQTNTVMAQLKNQSVVTSKQPANNAPAKKKVENPLDKVAAIRNILKRQE